MKIATFNVNGITSRLPRVLEWLAESQPDVACLQELKTSDATFPDAAFRDAGYGAVWHGQKGFNGVAVLAKGDAPIELRRGLPGDPDDTHSRVYSRKRYPLGHGGVKGREGRARHVIGYRWVSQAGSRRPQTVDAQPSGKGR